MSRLMRAGILMTILAVLLAACGPNRENGQQADRDGDGGASETANSPDGELTAGGEIFVYGMSYENADEIATTRVDHFTSQYPDVSVTFSESDFSAETLIPALRGSEPPDVIRMPRNIAGGYIQRGIFEPLGECLERAGVDPSIYQPSAMEQLTVDGTIYGLPQAYITRAWLIDNSVFEAAGLDPAAFDWSDWDAIRAANQTILDAVESVKVGIDPKVSDPTSADMFPLWVHANGGELISEDGQPRLNAPEVVEALEFVASMIEPYGSHAAFLDARGATGDFFGAENQFVLDTEGAFPVQQTYLNTLATNSPDVEITAAPFMTRDGEPFTWADGDVLGISATSDNKDAACAFITSVLSTDAWVAAAEARQQIREEEGVPNLGTVSGNVEADRIIFSEIVDLADYPVFEAAVQTYLDVQDAAFVIPRSVAAEQVQQAWATAVDRVLNGNADPQAALDQAQAEAEAAIADAGG